MPSEGCGRPSPDDAVRDAARARRVRLAATLVMAVVSSMSALLAAELVVRECTVTDADGQRFFRGRRLRPYQVPVAALRARLAELDGGAASYLMYDARLGWTIRPGGRSADGVERANAAGLRADREFAPRAAPGVLRIGLFGDSFTHGDELALADTWGVRLERVLAEHGIRVEVVNFGVPAYGMDQAFLRWRRLGRRYGLDLVLFGWVAEDVYRNVNVVRSLYYPGTDLPFSKPRFVLTGGRLRLVNRPAVAPAALAQALADDSPSGLRTVDFFYRPADYRPRWWQRSRLAGVLSDLLDPDPTEAAANSARFFAPDGEPARVTVAVLRTFRREVEASGARLWMVDLPRRADLERLADGLPLAHEALLDRLRGEHQMVETRDALLARMQGWLFAPGGHYAPLAAEVIARVVGHELVRRLRPPVELAAGRPASGRPSDPDMPALR